MKVVELKLSEPAKGSPLQVMECAGVYVGDGDALLVPEKISDRMVKQYRGKLVKGASREVDSLRHGHYELSTSGSSKSVASKAVQPPAEEGETNDRSMGTSTGEPKRKTKKKKTSKRKKED